MGDGDTAAEVGQSCRQTGIEEDCNASSSHVSSEAPAPITRWMSPLDIRFSQLRMRPEFRDGRLVDDCIEQIETVRTEDGCWKLVPPFPPIQITKWRCKLRDADGRPKINSGTRTEMFSAQERWFTLDNRRLYCLQKAAAARWPDPVSCEIVEMGDKLEEHHRTLKKFRTADSGHSIRIGDRSSAEEDLESLPRWAWREAVGLDGALNSDDENEGVASSRARPRRGGFQNRTSQKPNPSGDDAAKRRRQPKPKRCEGSNGFVPMPQWALSVAVFVIIYCSLRIGAEYIKKYLAGAGVLKSSS